MSRRRTGSELSSASRRVVGSAGNRLSTFIALKNGICVQNHCHSSGSVCSNASSISRRIRACSSAPRCAIAPNSGSQGGASAASVGVSGTLSIYWAIASATMVAVLLPLACAAALTRTIKSSDIAIIWFISHLFRRRASIALPSDAFAVTPSYYSGDVRNQ